MIHCFNVFYEFIKRVCTMILTVLAPQVLRNVRVHLVLMNSSPTYPMSERLPTRLLFVCTSYRVNEMQRVVLKPCALCSRNCYFLWPVRHTNRIFFYCFTPSDSNEHSIRYIPSSNKNWMQAFSFIINDTRSTVLMKWSVLIHTFCAVWDSRFSRGCSYKILSIQLVHRADHNIPPIGLLG
jgi:hypothetical protein